MLRALAAFATSVLLTTSYAGNTGWLEAGHPRFEVMFDYRVKLECTSDCARYAMLLRYASGTPAESSELTEWNAFSSADCIDLLLPGKKSFACRLPDATSDELRDGRRTAMSRFHVSREQLNDLLAPAAVLRIEQIEIRLPPRTRAALRTFLQ